MRIDGLHTVDYSSMIPPQTNSTFQTTTQKNGTNSSSQKMKNDNLQELKKQQVVAELQQIDQKVRAHEMAHLSAAGELARGGASYQYAKGPDGKQYAIAGEVPIDISPGKTPAETIKKMERVIAAALAPADPSPQDYNIAAKAAQMKLQAQIEATKDSSDNSNVDIYA